MIAQPNAERPATVDAGVDVAADADAASPLAVARRRDANCL